MNLRSILNGIAALAAIGVFYTFAFCMVDSVEDTQISQEYYYNTATETVVQTEHTQAPAETAIASVNRVTEKTYNKERFELPEVNDVLRINSKMKDAHDYMASPLTETPIVVTPIFDGKTEAEEKPIVTSVPETVEAEESATESAGADISAEPEPEIEAEELFDDIEIPEDNDIAVFSAEPEFEFTSPSQSYMDALHYDNAQSMASEEEIMRKMAEMEKELNRQRSSETAPTTVTTAPETFTFSDTYFETTAATSIVATSPDGAEIFTAKVDGEEQEFDAYELVCMIVSTEMSPSFSPEALKAQAVAAYSYVKYHNEKGLVPSVLVKREIPEEVTAAVNAVWGKCCYYNGKPAQTMYTASTAGTSASAVNVWGGDNFPYLTSVDTSFDELFDPNYGVVSSYSEDYMRNALERTYGITLSDDPENWLVVASRFDGNYVDEVIIDGQVIAKGKQIREKVTKYGLKSWCFDVSYSEGEFIFVTYGYGHGVGMSQNGANYLGKQGYTYDQILAFYFPGITIE